MTKHIKIRTSTFETNSSSTHAYTVWTGKQGKATFRPIITETIKVEPVWYATDDWKTKLSALVAYLYIQNRKDEIANIQDIFLRFTGTEPSFDFSKVQESLDDPKYPFELEWLFEEFSPNYDGNYGNEPKELIEFLDRILLTEEDILAFVCSNGWIETNEYYDG